VPVAAFDERRQGAQRQTRVDHVRRQQAERGLGLRVRRGAPALIGPGVVVQEAEAQRVPGRIRALEAGAANHHIDAVPAHIGPDAVPEQLDRLFRAVGRQHAGAAQLQEAQALMRLQQRRDVELALGVETAMALGHILPQQAVCADNALPLLAKGAGRVMVDDQKMVADRVKPVGVAAQHQAGEIRLGRLLLIEHPVTEALRAPEVQRSPGQTDLQGAAAAQRGLILPEPMRGAQEFRHEWG
jgi:hypothetical protein